MMKSLQSTSLGIKIILAGGLVLALVVFLHLGREAFISSDFKSKIEGEAKTLSEGEERSFDMGSSQTLCFQAPYVREIDFTSAVGKPIPGYRIITSNGEFGVHIFGQNSRYEFFKLGDNMLRLDRARIKSVCNSTPIILLRKQGNFVLVGFSEN